MKCWTYRVSLALTVLAVLGLPVAAVAQQPSTKMVPFRFTWVATGDPSTIPLNPPVRAVRASFTNGQSDLLGPFTGIGHHITRLSADGNPFYVTEGRGTITAANGDAVFFSYVGLIRSATTPGSFSVEEAVTITGGTGRFVGATGSGVINEVVDISKRQGIDTFEGMITAPRP